MIISFSISSVLSLRIFLKELLDSERPPAISVAVGNRTSSGISSRVMETSDGERDVGSPVTQEERAKS